MERKLRLAIAGFQAFTSLNGVNPHIKLETGFELTKLESNRDEWGVKRAILPAVTSEACLSCRSLGRGGRYPALGEHQRLRAVRSNIGPM